MVGTLEDVAERSGVSRSTVSRAINGGSVSVATRLRVQVAMQATAYKPNLAARKLASGRSGVVGAVIHVAPTVLFQDRYFSRLLHAVSGALADRGAGMMLWLAELSKEETLDRIVGMRLLDGLIVTADLVVDPLVDGLIASSLPIVLVGHRHKDRSVSYVDINNVAAADRITTHLISLGRTRVGHVTGSRGGVSAEERLTGYRLAMDRAGLSTADLIAEGDYLPASGAAGAAELVAAGADAIFFASDAMAMGGLPQLARRGVRIPDHIAVAGFDDEPGVAAMAPPLTTMRQDIRQLGIEAANSLFRLLDHPASGPQRVILPTELMIRQSTVGRIGGPALADDTSERTRE